MSSPRTYNRIHTKGFGLIEVIIASAVLLVIILTTTICYNTYAQYALANQSTVQAGYLSEEGLEAITFLRDRGWTAYIAPLSVNTTYYLAFNGSTWLATTTPQYIDGQFLRSFTMRSVTRDSNDDISFGVGTVDPNTLLVTESVSYYQGHATTTKTLSTYITNINNN